MKTQKIKHNNQPKINLKSLFGQIITPQLLSTEDDVIPEENKQSHSFSGSYSSDDSDDVSLEGLIKELNKDRRFTFNS